MKSVILTKKNGTSFNLFSKTVPHTVESARQDIELLGRDTVTLTVKSGEPITFDIGDKINIIGREYTLNTPPRERKAGDRLFFYDMVFEGMQYELMRATYSVNVDTTTNEIQDISGDSLTGNLEMFLRVLVSNANRVFGAGKWILDQFPEDTPTKTITFNDGDNCLSVLQRLCSEENFNTEFSIKTDIDGNRLLSAGEVGELFPYVFKYGKNKGLYDLVREKLDSTNIITRLHAYGSNRNIVTSRYKMPDGTFRGLRLCLPNKKKGTSYIEDSVAISKYGLWEFTKIFDDIYPTRKGTITSLDTDHLTFVDSAMDFDLNEKEPDGKTTKYLIPGVSAKIHFNTGNLAGYEFELESYNHAWHTFKIIPQKDENGYSFPSETSAAFQFSVGDEYVITDIFLPSTYVTEAEVRLASAAQEYLYIYSKPQVKYSLQIEPPFLRALVGDETSSNIFMPGDYIEVLDDDMDADVTLRIKSFNRDLLKEYNYDLTIADRPVTVSTLTEIVNKTTNNTTVITTNRLNDPARGRRNWMAAQEVLNRVFDTEGYYYSDAIKPLSIDTTMLSVGAKSMQFSIEGIVFQANYLGNNNRVVSNSGLLVHYAILDSSENPRVWNIASNDTVLNTSAERYIYARCQVSGSGGAIVYSTEKIVVDSEPGYYNFLIGMISSVIDQARTMTLMFGFTTINGRFIKTGRIQSADGNTYFDLDTGVFQGVFKFTSGQSIEDYISSQFSNLKVGGRNLLINSAYPLLNPNTTGSGESVLMTDEAENYRRATPSAGIAVSLFGAQYAHVAGNEHMSSIYVRQNSGSQVNITLYQAGNPGDSTKTTSVPSGVWTQITTNKYITSGNSFLILICQTNTIALDYKKVKIEYGTVATDWTPAPEDIDAEIAAQKNYIDTVTSDLQAQVDGVVDSWFYPYTPTIGNEPAVSWNTTELKARHVGDTFTNTQAYVDDITTPDAGKSWRWIKSGGVYSWTQIADSDAVKALLEAAQAKDIADGKRRVFTAQPTNAQAYDVGDMWVNATYSGLYTNDLLRCYTAKAAGVAFNISHWGLATKYTDDTTALLAAALAKYGGGKMLYRDPTFASGMNSIALYNNNGGTAVTLQRIARQSDNPSTSTHQVRIIFSGGSNGSSPGLGGFRFETPMSRPGAIYLIRIVAKIPTGYNLEATYNSIGTGGNHTWLTSRAGAATYQDYIVMIKCGISGTFSNFGYIYLEGAATPGIEWQVAYATIFDALDPEMKATEYLREALQGSTDITGGLLATNVLLMKNSVNEITGGMSGLSTDNVGMWTGGTYEQAIAGLSNILLRKDGSGLLAKGKIFWDLLGKLNVGNFEIVGGAIVGYDTNGGERVRFSVEDIPAIADMVNSFVTASDEYTGSGWFGAESMFDYDGGFWYTQIITGNSTMTIQKNVVIPYATYLRVQAAPVVIVKGANVISTTTYQNVIVKNQYGTTVASGSVNTNLSIPSAGTYTVQLFTEIGATLEDGTSGAVDFTVEDTYVRYIESVEKTFIGKDGILTYFSSSEYMHFKKGQGLKVKGAGTDLPGVLVSGSISSTGTVSRNFGAKYVSGSKTGTGTYRINHSIGHTNYAVQLTSQTSTRLAHVGTKYNDYVIIYATNTSGTLTDTGLEFLITGSN